MVLSFSTLAGLASLVALLLVYGYSAYWALLIRNVLPIRVYRNRSFGTFIVAIVMFLLSFYTILPSYLFDPTVGNGIGGVIILTLVSAGLFYWIDTTAPQRAGQTRSSGIHFVGHKCAKCCGL